MVYKYQLAELVGQFSKMLSDAKEQNKYPQRPEIPVSRYNFHDLETEVLGVVYFYHDGVIYHTNLPLSQLNPGDMTKRWRRTPDGRIFIMR